MLEAKTDKINIHMLVKEDSILKRYSTFSRLIRITAYILRFSINSRHKADRLNDLVIKDAHHATLHGGVQLTLAQTRLRFWIVNGRVATKRMMRGCMQCFRACPTTGKQLMGNLPTHRINPPCRPFWATGIDYTGAIELNASRLRGTATYKGYIAIFICLLVTGLTSDHFLWALDRFIRRRGLCRHIYSYNGTNFVGTDKALRNELSRQRDNENTAAARLVDKQIEWHFSPPRLPNFGGLWEANVKTVKHHLTRMAGSSCLTYEEFSTVLIRIEVCLNSRPLRPLTADPEDLSYLTPGHFLNVAPPEWRDDPWILKEVDSGLACPFSETAKWCEVTENLQLNDLVILKDDGTPPA
ncbi:uncharacterized protein [Drosophila takahashii]|uniref:uncharacterized protein n=1 Tax=Drosophila takahashii TaxID=29030 RepID=UPI003898DFC8